MYRPVCLILTQWQSQQPERQPSWLFMKKCLHDPPLSVIVSNVPYILDKRLWWARPIPGWMEICMNRRGVEHICQSKWNNIWSSLFTEPATVVQYTSVLNHRTTQNYNRYCECQIQLSYRFSLHAFSSYATLMFSLFHFFFSSSVKSMLFKQHH